MITRIIRLIKKWHLLCTHQFRPHHFLPTHSERFRISMLHHPFTCSHRCAPPISECDGAFCSDGLTSAPGVWARDQAQPDNEQYQKRFCAVPGKTCTFLVGSRHSPIRAASFPFPVNIVFERVPFSGAGIRGGNLR